MLHYTQGNLLDATTEAVVNTVNEVGVMGKGIALMFKEAFPDNFKAYAEACKRGEVQVGHMFVTENRELSGPKWIINFPTKKHWRHPARIEWIEEGLRDLRRWIEKQGIHSISVPPLGCGNGGLEWHHVRPKIELALKELGDVEVYIYEPAAKYLNEAKRAGINQLTPARALIAELVRRYWVLGIECTCLEIQKLAWFLQRNINALQLKDILDLRFKADKYGPYSERLRHLLNGLDGSFLHCAKRLSDAGPLDTIWFEETKKGAVTAFLEESEAAPYLPALDQTSLLLDGFESPMGMELLATVDWLLFREHCEPTIGALKAGLQNWPGGMGAGQRKLKLFNDRLLELALKRVS